MAAILQFGLIVLCAYLIGAVPFGLIVVAVTTGQDIRKVGSGRTGGTNAMRAAGFFVGLVTALSDVGKGTVAVYLGNWILGESIPVLQACCGVAAVVGHNWPVYLKFKGGAGASPNVGAAIGIWGLPAALILIPFGAALLFGIGYASVASTIICLTVVIMSIVQYVLWQSDPIYIMYAMVTFIMVAFALIPNYRRLRDGAERMVGPRAKGRKTGDNAGVRT